MTKLGGEDTFQRVKTILNTTLSKDDANLAIVANAFRLGNKRRSFRPRKILVEMRDSKGKDIVLKNARVITKSGNNGKHYYINDDSSDGLEGKEAICTNTRSI